MTTLLELLLRSAVILFLINEVRGSILAIPVLYAMYLTGGTITALWIGFCSLFGIALSVIFPLFIAKKFKLLRPSSAR